MDVRIIYQPPGLPLAIMTPCDCGLTALEIGQKDVPENLPFWIVPVSSLPTDETYRDAWIIDPSTMAEPSGIGGTYKPADKAVVK